MKNANPAPLGVFTFGLSSLVVGALFAGWFGSFNAGNMMGAAVTALSTGVILHIVNFLMIRGNALADSAGFSMWGGAVFGYFGQVWIVLGLILLNWKTGVGGPLAFLLLYTCLFSVGYLIYSFKLKIWSFVILFIDVVIAAFCGFLGVFYGWAEGNMIAGYLFIFLMPLALYIAFKEQLAEVWPKPS